MKPTLLILAAGMGSRFGGLKQLEPVGPGGETILDYSIFDAQRAGFGKIVFVIRQSFAEEFTTLFESKIKGRIETSYVFQELDDLPEGYSLPEGRVKPWGTGHAILMAKNVINEPFASINADDFYGAPAFEAMADFLTNGVSADMYSMVGYMLKNTLSEFGSVSRGTCKTDKAGNLLEITERTKIIREGGQITDISDSTTLDENTPVSMNFWGFHPSLFRRLEELFRKFLDEKMNQPKSEFYIPEVVFSLIDTNRVHAKVLTADSPWFGITYPEDKKLVTDKIRHLVDAGCYPPSLW